MIELEIIKNKKPKKYPTEIIILIMFTVIFIFSYKTWTYDQYKTLGITQNKNNKCLINVSLPYNKITDLKKTLIEYKNEKYKIKNISYNETKIKDNIPYEDVTITIENKCQEQVADVKILNNKQRIIYKIIKIIREA